jgi:oxalate decarboxylase/phosphoglucose isomerase-like protein (cupin superfamily)
MGNGPEWELIDGRPRLAGGWSAVRAGVRLEQDLAPVNAAADRRSDEPVYWTFGDVAAADDRERLSGAPVSYDLTLMSPRPLGGEHPRTHGHVHVSADGRDTGFAEVYEVLAGKAAFLIQDLRAGPEAAFSVAIEAQNGDVVALPPGVQHVTVNVGPDLLVVADLVCRRADDAYDALRSAGGMAYGISLDGQGVPNARYRSVPVLRRTDAHGWGATMPGGLYQQLRDDPSAFDWLCDEQEFARRYPDWLVG